MKKILLMCLFVLFGTMAFAQFAGSKSGSATTTEGWSGLRVSYGFNTLKGVDDYDGREHSETRDITELSASWVKGISLSSNMPLFLEVGPELSWVTGKLKDGEWLDFDDCKYNQISVSIPVNIGYKIQATDDISVFPYVGLKGKFNLTENMSWKGDQSESLFDDHIFDSEETPGRRLQAGWQIGCGFNINKFHVGLSYNADLSNFAYSEYEDHYYDESETISLKNSSIRLTVGLNF